MAEPVRCGSDEDAVGGDMRMREGLVDDVDVEEGLRVGCFGLVIEVLATAHLYFEGQSKAR